MDYLTRGMFLVFHVCPLVTHNDLGKSGSPGHHRVDMQRWTSAWILLKGTLFGLHRLRCCSVSRSRFSHNLDEQLAVQKAKTKVQRWLRVKLNFSEESLFDSLDHFHFPKREKSLCLSPFYMKHNYGHHLMPVTFELASIMYMPSHWLAHTPRRVQSSVSRKTKVSFNQHMTRKCYFLKN